MQGGTGGDLGAEAAAHWLICTRTCGRSSANQHCGWHTTHLGARLTSSGVPGRVGGGLGVGEVVAATSHASRLWQRGLSAASERQCLPAAPHLYTQSTTRTTPTPCPGLGGRKRGMTTTQRSCGWCAAWCAACLRGGRAWVHPQNTALKPWPGHCGARMGTAQEHLVAAGKAAECQDLRTPRGEAAGV